MVVYSKLFGINDGIEILTGVETNLINRTMMVQITHSSQNEKGQWGMTKTYVEVPIYEHLQYIVLEIIEYVESINHKTGHYFDRYPYLTELVLDTKTMIATTRWASDF